MKRLGFFAKMMRRALIGVLLILAAYVIWKLFHYVVLNDGLMRKGLGKVLGLFGTMFKAVVWGTVPSLLLPIGIYFFIELTLRNMVSIIRVAAGIGSIYLLWRFSGSMRLTVNPAKLASDALTLAKLCFQVYYLIILVLPQELMSIIGAGASFIGAMIVALIPSLPTAYDDIAAISTIIVMIFVVLNTSAVAVKRVVRGIVKPRTRPQK